MDIKKSFRVVFSINEIPTPFVWKGLCGIVEFSRALTLANILCKFDVGLASQEEIENSYATQMIKSYKAYRRKHEVNHPDMIWVSDCCIDQFDGKDWWTVSNDLETEEHELGWVEAFDTSDDAWERYQHLIDEMLTETTVGSFDDISLHDL